MKLFITYIFLLVTTAGFAKEIEVDTFLIRMESEINTQLEIVRATKDDNQRYLENESLQELIESILAHQDRLNILSRLFKPCRQLHLQMVPLEYLIGMLRITTD